MANLPGIIQLSDLANFTASATALGLVQLLGDFGGTATLPEVVGLQGIPISSTLPIANEVLTFNGTAWVPTFLGSMAVGGDLRGSILDATVVGIQGVHILPYAPATSGTSTSGATPSTDLTNLSPLTTAAVGVTVDGFTLPFVTFNALTSISGVTIAANLQNAINAALAAFTTAISVQALTVSPSFPYTVTLFPVPVSIPTIPGYSYTSGIINATEFTVDFLTGITTFNVAAAGASIVATYEYTLPLLSVTAIYNGTNYVVTSNSTGLPSSVVFSAPVFSAPLANWPDVTPLLELGVANGGTEVRGTAAAIPPGFVLTSGVANTASWQLNTVLPVGPAGGDLSGTYPNPTVARASGNFTVDGNLDVVGFSHLDGGDISTDGSGKLNATSLEVSGPNSFSAAGGTVTTSGINTIHTFTSSGSFICSGAGLVNVLVVAGGGGGGVGGGGAGGVISNLSFPVSGTITVTVGAGGAGGLVANGTNGADSIFSSLDAVGGGGGGVNAIYSGSAGGSGGGAMYTGLGGAGTIGQGHAGGNGDGTSPPYPGGGGGGAGTPGAISVDGSTGGHGGDGILSSISGTSTYYGGGGGGSSYVGGSADGIGGLGGGGNGNQAGIGAAGTPNTGGGGGGSDTVNVGGAGGSGIVIVSYPSTSVAKFEVNPSGDIVILNSVPTSFPSVQGAAGTLLTNNGSGTLTWESAAAVNPTTSIPVSAITIYTVIHNLGYRPLVQILDSSGYLEIPNSVQHTSVNAFTVTWAISFTGTILYR